MHKYIHDYTYPFFAALLIKIRIILTMLSIQTNTYSKSAIEKLGKGVKYVNT